MQQRLEHTVPRSPSVESLESDSDWEAIATEFRCDSTPNDSDGASGAFREEKSSNPFASPPPSPRAAEFVWDDGATLILRFIETQFTLHGFSGEVGTRTESTCAEHGDNPFAADPCEEESVKNRSTEGDQGHPIPKLIESHLFSESLSLSHQVPVVQSSPLVEQLLSAYSIETTETVAIVLTATDDAENVQYCAVFLHLEGPTDTRGLVTDCISPSSLSIDPAPRHWLDSDIEAAHHMVNLAQDWAMDKAMVYVIRPKVTLAMGVEPCPSTLSSPQSPQLPLEDPPVDTAEGRTSADVQPHEDPAMTSEDILADGEFGLDDSKTLQQSDDGARAIVQSTQCSDTILDLRSASNPKPSRPQGAFDMSWMLALQSQSIVHSNTIEQRSRDLTPDPDGSVEDKEECGIPQASNDLQSGEENDTKRDSKPRPQTQGTQFFDSGQLSLLFPSRRVCPATSRVDDDGQVARNTASSSDNVNQVEEERRKKLQGDTNAAKAVIQDLELRHKHPSRREKPLNTGSGLDNDELEGNTLSASLNQTQSLEMRQDFGILQGARGPVRELRLPRNLKEARESPSGLEYRIGNGSDSTSSGQRPHMSEKAKMKQRAIEPESSIIDTPENCAQLDLLRRATSSRPIRRVPSTSLGSDKKPTVPWSPLFLRPELLKADTTMSKMLQYHGQILTASPTDGEGSFPSIATKSPIRAKLDKKLRSRLTEDDVAWQLALVSQVLGPSEDYLREKEEKFIKLNPRYKPEKFDCLICFETINGVDGSRLMNCEHSFCQECMVGHVLSQLQDNVYPILCPVCFADPDRAGTPGYVDDFVFEHLGLTQKDMDKFQELQLAAFIVKIDCPGCKGNLVIAREYYLEQPLITCTLDGCSSRFCRACLMVMTGSDDEHACKVDEEFEALMKTNGWRYCPGCRTPIQKESGCNHMTCRTPGCSTHFCYICGVSIWNSTSIESLANMLNSHWLHCVQFDPAPMEAPIDAGAVAPNRRTLRRGCVVQ